MRSFNEASAAAFDASEPDSAETFSSYRNPYWEGYAAVTHNRFGNGNAWYAGAQFEGSELKHILRDVCASAGIPVPGLEYPIVYRKAVAADGAVLHFLFNVSWLSQTIRSPAAGEDLMTGSRVEAEQGLVLPSWGTAILREPRG